MKVELVQQRKKEKVREKGKGINGRHEERSKRLEGEKKGLAMEE